MSSYAIRSRQTFEQIVDVLISALKDKGFTARRSFDLQSAMWDQADQVTNYCVLMVEAASTSELDSRLHTLTVHQREGQLILHLLDSNGPIPCCQTPKAISLPLESALVDLLIENGWWSMEESQTAV